MSEDSVLLEDGLYRMDHGKLERLETEDSELKRIRVSVEVFEQLRELQKRSRVVMRGRKPDLNLLAEAVLVQGLKTISTDDVKKYIAEVYAN